MVTITTGNLLFIPGTFFHNNEFTVTSVDDKHIYISIPGNATVNQLSLNLDEIKQMLESEEKFDKIKDVTVFWVRPLLHKHIHMTLYFIKEY